MRDNSIMKKGNFDNFLQFLLYQSTTPIVSFFRFLKITPNKVTFLSVFTNIVAVYFLIQKNIPLFIVLWYVSHYLDYCDGSLARLTGNTTKILLRVDHYSDLVKIFITFIALSYFYANSFFWLVNSIFIFLLLFYNIFSLEVSKSLNIDNKIIESMGSKRQWHPLIKNLYNIFFTFNGHSLLLVGCVSLDLKWGFIIVSYYILLIAKSIYSPFIYLVTNYRNESEKKIV